MSAVEEAVKSTIKTLDSESLVPVRDPKYVPFGFYNELKEIIGSKIFYTVYITGLSGNGKTMMVEQACAETGREYIRVNITKETDEFDLIGSYELVNGDTVWRDGPALVAMKRGALLLLDETDLGSERLLCLQSILEGKGYFNKKRCEFITPAHGFNVMATANTKGKGSDDGRFIGTNVLNEAFLERFAITVEQEYPSEAVEKSILLNLFKTLPTSPSMRVEDFATKLSKWAELVRRAYKEEATTEIISTRRLTHIANAYSIFRNRRKAIELCLNRFDAEVKVTFLDFYTKIDPNIDSKVNDRPGDPAAGPDVFDPVTGQLNQDALVAARKQAQVKNSTPIPQTQGVTGAGSSQAIGPTALGSNVVIFGDGRNIQSVGAKYKVAIRVDRNPSTGDATIIVNGMRFTVTATEIMTATDDLLDRVVGIMLAKVGMIDPGLYTTS